MDHEKRTKKKRNHLPFRLNILFLAVFLAFSVLILRLGVVQIVKGKEYQDKANETDHAKTQLDSARGKIYAANGTVLADNQAELAVVYIRKPGTTSKDNLKTAKKLAKLINMDDSKVTERDEKDYWILTHSDAYDQKLTQAEQKNFKEDPKEADKAYDLVLDRITKKDLDSISKADMEVIAIKRELDQSTDLTPHFIKKDLSEKELALIGEHLGDFDGKIDTAVASTRKYPNGDYFFLGQVKDIPSELVDGFLAKGYNRNDKVGVSNLEEEYEDALRGIPTTLTFTTKNGKAVNTPEKKEGQRGYDIQLTINNKLQKEIAKIIDKDISNTKHTFPQPKLDSAYAVVMDPHTGGILAIVGRKIDHSTGKFEDASSGAIYNAFQMGSAVKGATVLGGFQYNAVPEYFNDMPIVYKNGGRFKSYSDFGTLTPETALEHSSNVFMAKIASNMAGFKLRPENGHYKARVFTGEHYRKAFENLRQAYGQFGLGVETGVDLPFESTGYEGGIPKEGGKIMQFAIGQFDTYTPLQLAQYASTIANGGYRLAPHFLKSIHAPTNDPKKLGPTIYHYEPKVLNHIKNTQEEIDRVQRGFYLVTHAPNGTAPSLGHRDNAKYKIAAKTGTAQIDVENDPELYNKSLVAYAPYDDPKVVVAVVVPEIKHGETNLDIAQDIFKAYDKLTGHSLTKG
ncbi:cell elongation-specific peptidoglycan D,D-transpeptidase [Scopulibacillus darangshiensis]|uniref:Cell elongation-specific peptidoglycan D,D-transpeptidase n=1 Tax=Scopulibacillus darangshiensis TaxID=442528 RepID=A0A4R2P878_9BACL|nr:penicillin-binding transpeptidase domain-containing protein [Scopulibacillus darangshiensis]TCP31133.1 cell elongation-specific peptidoglycan D,D-transpeptidase [Scopulibacillus darangshiensis]